MGDVLIGGNKMPRNKIVQIKVLDSECEEIKYDAQRIGILGLSAWGRIVIKKYFDSIHRTTPDKNDDAQSINDAAQ